MHFNWCATAIGVLPKGLSPITGRDLAPGHTVYSLRSRGFRSNGFSLVRRVMEAALGPEWHREGYDETRTWGDVLLTPCLIYSPFITRLREEGVTVSAVAHITGGGVEDNLVRMLKSAGVGAKLDNLHDPLPFMRRVQELGNVPEEQAYRLWNMGNGMLLTSPPQFAAQVQGTAADMGYDLRVAGIITKDPVMEIHTRGLHPTVLVRTQG